MPISGQAAFAADLCSGTTEDSFNVNISFLASSDSRDSSNNSDSSDSSDNKHYCVDSRQ